MNHIARVQRLTDAIFNTDDVTAPDMCRAYVESLYQAFMELNEDEEVDESEGLSSHDLSDLMSLAEQMLAIINKRRSS